MLKSDENDAERWDIHERRLPFGLGRDSRYRTQMHLPGLRSLHAAAWFRPDNQVAVSDPPTIDG